MPSVSFFKEMVLQIFLVLVWQKQICVGFLQFLLHFGSQHKTYIVALSETKLTNKRIAHLFGKDSAALIIDEYMYLVQLVFFFFLNFIMMIQISTVRIYHVFRIKLKIKLVNSSPYCGDIVSGYIRLQVFHDYNQSSEQKTILHQIRL